MKWNYYSPEFECDKINVDLLRYSPWSGHRNFIYDLMANWKPHTVVELGSYYGCSAFAIAQAIKDFQLLSVFMEWIPGGETILRRQIISRTCIMISAKLKMPVIQTNM